MAVSRATAQIAVKSMEVTLAAESILYDMHMHTPLCKHARGEPEDYASAARQRGLKGIVITCHNPTDDGWSPRVRMSIDEFDTYVGMVERARSSWAGQVDVRLGLECDYIPGMERWLETLLRMADFHHVLGSVHPHLSQYQDRFFTGNFQTFAKTYFEHVAMAAETGLFDTIAHPDLVKNCAPAQWNTLQMTETMCDCLDRIAAAGAAMELNTSGSNKTYPEMNPGMAMLEEMQKRNIPVVIGSDAHDPFRVADAFAEALDILSAAGYSHTHIVLDRKRQMLPIFAARESLQQAAKV